MKTIYLTILAFFVIGTTQAQNNWCKTDQILKELEANNPEFAQHMHKAMSKAGSEHLSQQKATLYIPVVVHIIHDNGIGNISTAQVEDAIQILNDDFNRQNSDASNTRNTGTAPFVPVAGGLDVKFILAKKDPDGNCTNGIVRVNAPSLTFNANDDCKYSANGGSDQWPMDQYLNIWVINSIESDGAGVTLGYAYLPYWPNGANYGILIRHDSFGSIGTAQGADGRTLTHEMGHLLGLNHIFDAGWGGQTGCHADDCNQNGDYVCDTPPQADANWSCSQIWNSCPDVPLNDPFGFDVVDQIENYMSYNSCQNMFSIGQMDLVAFNFTDIDFMADMVTPANILATGINDPAVLCKADFEASKTLICAGDTINFTDFSFEDPTTWTWTIQGNVGTDFIYINSTSASSQNPVVKFLNGGTYNVELTAASIAGSDIETKNAYIKVMPSPASVPYFEGFENYTTLNNIQNWSVVDYGNNAKFDITNSASHSGSKAARLGNFNQEAGNYDELISAPIDMSTVADTENVTLSFRYAYRKRNTSNDEWLKVFVTGNCGENWAQRKTLHGSQLSTSTASTSWTPTSADWITVHMTNVTNTYYTPSFMIKFRFESDNGNNFYLDDINLYKGAPSEEIVLGLEEASLLSTFNIYPNPAEKEVNIAFSLENATPLSLVITDVFGKQVNNHSIQATVGQNIVQINTESLNSGLYFVKLGDTVKSFMVK